ncbi:MAG: ABC transporter ATP-binding protein [Acidobacteriota bacterium]
MTPPEQIESLSTGSTPIKKKEDAVLLRAEGIRAGYGKKEVLHGVDLEVKAGEIVVLAGANGAGKSTLLKVVAGLLKPIAGRVCFNGKDATHLLAHERSRLGIGYLLQGGEVFPSLTVRENLSIALGDGSPDSQALDAVLNLFPLLGAKLQRRAGLLSGGERQMLALGMVLVRRSGLLLLDEPTAALAPPQAAEALQKIADYSRRLGVGVVLVEQRLRRAATVADRVIILAAGQVLRQTGEPLKWLNSAQYDLDLLGGVPSERPTVGDDSRVR